MTFAWLDIMTTQQLLWWLLWLGLVLLTGVLIYLIRAPWGRSKPLHKCMLLSLLVHVALAGYATTVQIVTTYELPTEPHVLVTTLEPFQEAQQADSRGSAQRRPWNLPTMEVPPLPQAKLDRPEMTLAALDRDAAPSDAFENMPFMLAKMSDAHAPRDVPDRIARPQDMSHVQQASATAIETLDAQRVERRASPVPGDLVPQPSSDTGLGALKTEPPQRSRAATEQRETLPLPRLSDPVSTPEPADALADSVDLPSRLTSPAPAAERVLTDVAEGDRETPTDARRPGTELAKTSGPPLPKLPGVRQMADISSPEGARHASAAVARQKNLPAIYKLRFAPDRNEVTRRHGGTAATEAAVESALYWLARAQTANGSWNAHQHDGGRDDSVDGQSRPGTGARADSGITGLALLAFLGAGHTHQQGEHRETVRRGLEYLLSVQAPEGHLAGHANTYAFMYCHGIASFAMSEAYALSGDARLKPAVERAVQYTLSAQHPSTGGWRYRPGDLGDTSQLGWQLMALKSAELAGISIPTKSRDGAIKFLLSVSRGTHGGLASYRPNEQISHVMTAEALVCRQFLGMSRTEPAGHEAGDHLLIELPGKGRTNYYYYYYATLGMHQLGGQYWDKWNVALKQELVKTQVSSGEHAGSWSADSVWGSYGGRVFTTSLATLCLEVYYRYLPLYAEAGADTVRE